MMNQTEEKAKAYFIKRVKDNIRLKHNGLINEFTIKSKQNILFGDEYSRSVLDKSKTGVTTLSNDLNKEKSEKLLSPANMNPRTINDVNKYSNSDSGIKTEVKSTESNLKEIVRDCESKAIVNTPSKISRVGDILSQSSNRLVRFLEDINEQGALPNIIVLICSVVVTFVLCVTVTYHITKKQQPDITYSIMGLM